MAQPYRQLPRKRGPVLQLPSAAPYVTYWKKPVEQFLRNRVPKRQIPPKAEPPFPPIASQAPYVSYWKQPTNEPLRRTVKRQMPYAFADRLLPFFYSKTETLKDDFNAGSIDPFRWNSFGTTTTITEADGMIEMVTSTTNGYAGLDSARFYDLTGSFVSMQLVNAGNQALVSLEVIPIKVFDVSGNNTLFWYVNQNTLAVYKKVAGVQTQITNTPYNSGLHKYFRIRESGGTTFFDYSGDGENWTNFTSLANPINVTALTLEPSVGTFNNELSSTTVLMDNFNVFQPLLNTWQKPFLQPQRSNLRKLQRQQPLYGTYEPFYGVPVGGNTPANNVAFWKQAINQLQRRLQKRQQPEPNQPPPFPQGSQAPYVPYWKQPVSQPLRRSYVKRQQPRPNRPPVLPQSSEAPYVPYWAKPFVQPQRRNLKGRASAAYTSYEPFWSLPTGSSTPANNVGFWKQAVNQFLRNRQPKRQQPEPNAPPVLPQGSQAPYVSYWIHQVNQPLKNRVLKRQQPRYPQQVFDVPEVVEIPSEWMGVLDQPLRSRVPKRQYPPSAKMVFPPIVSAAPYLSYWKQPVNQFLRNRVLKRQIPAKFKPPFPPIPSEPPYLSYWVHQVNQPLRNRVLKRQIPQVPKAGIIKPLPKPFAIFGWIPQVQQFLKKRIPKRQMPSYTPTRASYLPIPNAIKIPVSFTISSGNKGQTVASGNKSENVSSGDKLSTVSTGIKNDNVQSGNKNATVSSGNKGLKL